MRVCVIGTGYVGLVAGAGFADMGNDVVCADLDADKIAALERGAIPFFEPGLEPLVVRNAREGRLRFTTDVATAVGEAEAVFVAVGTPPGPDGNADLSQVTGAAETIGRSMRRYTVVALKSTVPVGTADRVRGILAPIARHEFAVVSNPEFLKEGDAVNDFMKPDRVVVGTTDPRAREVLRRLYGPFVRTNDRMIFMDNRSAELTKYAANAMLATRVSFMNEIANLCEKLGADVDLVRRGVGTDPRIGSKFLFPGPGFGGSCFPKDLRALCGLGREAGLTLEIPEAVVRVNDRQKRVVCGKLRAHFGGELRGRRVALWGLAFKPETDDVRESPALAVAEELAAAGAAVVAHDPEAAESARKVLGDRVVYAPTAYDCVRGAEALALLTEWHAYRRPDFEKIRAAMASPVVVDARNAWDPDQLRGLGFTYYGIGRLAAVK